MISRKNGASKSLLTDEAFVNSLLEDAALVMLAVFRSDFF